MNEIVSRRHPLKFYVAIILGTAFLFFLGVLAFVAFWSERESGTLRSKHYFLPVVGLLIWIGAVYCVKMYQKNSPKIRINDEFISFNNVIYSVSELEKVRFTGKKSFPFIVVYFMESASLYFKDQTELVIFDDMYGNAPQLKARLSQIMSGVLPVPRKNTSSVVTGESQSFKGYLLFSYRACLMVGMSLLLLFAITSVGMPIAGKIAFSLLFMLVAVATVQLSYFVTLTGSALIIRNHILFWIKKRYPLNEIREVVYETRGKMPNCIRIITYDFSSKLYPAATLSQKTWLLLKKAIRARRIKVRNEGVL